jgi:hypothetical protein
MRHSRNTSGAENSRRFSPSSERSITRMATTTNVSASRNACEHPRGHIDMDPRPATESGGFERGREDAGQEFLANDAQDASTAFFDQFRCQGIKTRQQYEKLRVTLRSFPDEPLDTSEYEAAAKASNGCRSKGVPVSVVDALICTVGATRDWSIFTTDPDFRNYASLLPIRLHAPRR